MWKRNERHAVLHARTADGIFERDPPPEPIDSETTEKKDDLGLKQLELAVEPLSAERDLGGRGAAIAAPGQCLPWEALGDRGAVGQVLLVDARLGEPSAQLGAGSAAERLSGRELHRTGSLADDRDAVADRSGDDRTRPFDEAGVDAFRACADAGVQELEVTSAVHRRQLQV